MASLVRPYLALFVLAPASTCLTGCLENAVLELSVEVPARPADVPAGEELFAFVQVRGSTTPFEQDGMLQLWSVDPEQDPPGVALDSAPQTLDFSVVSKEENLGVHVKVRFCSGSAQSNDDRCINDDETQGQAVWYEIPKAFYIGERTEWTGRIDAVPDGRPTEPITVGKCEVGSSTCISGLGITNFCEDETTMVHYCE